LRFECFTDRDLGKRFPEILASARLSVKRHDDLFPPDCPDERWLAHVGESGWIAITHNARIRYMPNEFDAPLPYSTCGQSAAQGLGGELRRNDAPYSGSEDVCLQSFTVCIRSFTLKQ
jgi:hypothetical protein